MSGDFEHELAVLAATLRKKLDDHDDCGHGHCEGCFAAYLLRAFPRLFPRERSKESQG